MQIAVPSCLCKPTFWHVTFLSRQLLIINHFKCFEVELPWILTGGLPWALNTEPKCQCEGVGADLAPLLLAVGGCRG